MATNEKIRTIREANQWSQEEMAAKMNMSTNGYAKIERGETKLNLHKLEQITNIFNIDILELIDSGKSGVVLINENGDHSANYYGNSDNLTLEIEKLKLMLAHSQQTVQQKEDEIAALKEIIALLKER
ncbi:transcriptional regulator [Pasteurellaceae bacterium RH1A]|nr:transcriptional regulator [Pasteurellaceae bacterium RH1A]